MHDDDAARFAVDLGHRFAYRLQRTVGVGLDDDRQFGILGSAKILEKRGEPLRRRRCDQLEVSPLPLAFGRQGSGGTIVGHRLEEVAGLGYIVPPHHEYRSTRPSLVERGAPLVEHGSHPSSHRPRHDGITAAQGPPLHDHCRHRSSSRLELSLDHGS